MVALDTTVSPDLQMEGRARDLVRRIQVMRKEAGFEIIDRIVVTFDAGSELAAALEQYDEYVRTETLALEVREGLDLGMQTWSGEIAGEPVRLGVAKAAVVS